MLNKWFCLIMICLIPTLYGCTRSVKFVEFNSINSREWQSNDSQFFIYHNKSSHINGDIVLCINYTLLEKNKNIEIELEVQTPSNKLWHNRYKTTLEPINKAEKIEIKKEIKLIENCEFSDIGIYKFNVRLISPHSLNEVTSIGIAIK